MQENLRKIQKRKQALMVNLNKYERANQYALYSLNKSEPQTSRWDILNEMVLSNKEIIEQTKCEILFLNEKENQIKENEKTITEETMQSQDQTQIQVEKEAFISEYDQTRALIHNKEEDISFKEKEKNELFRDNINVQTEILCKMEQIRDTKILIDECNQKIEAIKNHLRELDITVFKSKNSLKLKTVLLLPTAVLSLLFLTISPYTLTLVLAFLSNAAVLSTILIEIVKINKMENKLLNKKQQGGTVLEKIKTSGANIKSAYQTKKINKAVENLQEEQLKHQKNLVDYNVAVSIYELELKEFQKKADEILGNLSDNGLATAKMMKELLRYYRYLTGSVRVSITMPSDEKKDTDESLSRQQKFHSTPKIKSMRKGKKHAYTSDQLK